MMPKKFLPEPEGKPFDTEKKVLGDRWFLIIALLTAILAVASVAWRIWQCSFAT